MWSRTIPSLLAASSLFLICDGLFSDAFQFTATRSGTSNGIRQQPLGADHQRRSSSSFCARPFTRRIKQPWNARNCIAWNLYSSTLSGSADDPRDLLAVSHQPEEEAREERRSLHRPRLTWLRRLLRLPGRRLRRRLSLVGLAVLTSLPASDRSTPLPLNLQPKSASAAIINPGLRKLETHNYEDMGFIMAREKVRQNQKEREAEEEEAFEKKYREIQRNEGLDASEEYKEKWTARRERRRERKLERKRLFVWKLIQDGVDPLGPLGQRARFKFEHGIDLAEIENTEQNRLQRLRAIGDGELYENRVAKMRRIFIKKVKSLKADNVDLVEYYLASEKVMDRPIYEQYLKAEREERGRLKKELDEQLKEVEDEFRKEGRASPKRDYTKAPGEEDEKSLKEKAKEKKRKLKAKLKEQARRVKMEKAEMKQKLKEEKRQAKEADRLEKQRAKEAAKEAVGAAAAAAVAVPKSAVETAATALAGADGGSSTTAVATEEGNADGTTTTTTATATTEEMRVDSEEELEGGSDDAGVVVCIPSEKRKPAVSLPITTVAKVTGATAVVGAAGAGGYYVFTAYKQKAAEEEAERQRQFNLIMGLENKDDDDGPNGDVSDSDSIMSATTTVDVQPTPDDKVDGDSSGSSSLLSEPKEEKTTPPDVSAPTATSTAPADSSPPKKKRGMLGSIFKKQNKSGRETSMENVLSESLYPATASYAQLLAKYLTVGAPGRFPHIEAMSHDDDTGEEDDTASVTSAITEDGKFQLDRAKENLIKRRDDMGISDKDAAETFANVVNVMILDLVDLASSAMSMGSNEDEKNKATVDALNVVLDFMDHAASLFDAVAKDVAITPVTYEGTLSKSKLEQMFSAYVGATMSTFDENAQGRMDTLQQVFSIRDKKAEGLVQKIMMKNLMKMMKEGGEGEGGMEGMAEMMAAMGGGGADGLEGMMPNMAGGEGGEGGEISPEELKQTVEMMKQLIDSGSVSKEELDIVRKQFKDTYGADISELIAAADNEDASKELGEDGKELLDLFKTVLDDNK